MTENLKDRLQSGIVLLERYLKIHGAELIALDDSMVATPRHWVATSGEAVSRHATRIDHVVQCGPLRRDTDGSWWWQDHLLGYDGLPSPSLDRVESSGSVVALALGDALEVTTELLDHTRHQRELQAARRVLYRCDHWKRSGTW
ncbi:MAG: hypothetical protein JKY37_26740 [Nannocystaceae bacterium]|nr:hypothetical protein [Nannocystaceae bacterium]